MKRKDFLKSVGLAGAGMGLPAINKAASTPADLGKGAVCPLIPTETAGPFPLDLTANTYYFRKNIQEDRTGVPLKVRLKIIGDTNCLPMQNVRVNIWHCDKDGLYSGYSQNNNAGQAGKTYLRGYQITDSNGEVEFNTIFPGWYTGRICHIHFQVYVSSAYAAISQLTFDIAKKNALYLASPALYSKGADPMTYASDNIFSDGYAYQLATLNSVTGGYETYLEVPVKGAGMVGIGHLEKEAAKYFSMGQNYPNPFSEETTIPFTLLRNAVVQCSLWDLEGRLVKTVDCGSLPPGTHTVPVHFAEWRLPIASYVYQLQVTHEEGTYTNCKMMTASR